MMDCLKIDDFLSWMKCSNSISWVCSLDEVRQCYSLNTQEAPFHAGVSGAAWATLPVLSSRLLAGVTISWTS